MQKWLIMISVAMGIFLATIDGSIVNIALPTLVKDFNAGFDIVQWVMLSYLLTIITLMLGMGRLGDIFGKKNLYLLGFLIFTTGSVLCGLSKTVYMLIIFRIFQAIGGAMIMALGLAIITQSFPKHQRGKALGIIGTVVSVGIASGPSIGGIILQFLSWKWIFFVNLPVGIIGIIMITKFVPNIKPDIKEPFDFKGAIIFFIALLALLLGLTLTHNLSITHPYIIGLFAIFIIGLVFFVQIEKNNKFPMIDLEILKNPNISINLINCFLTFFCISGIFILIPFYLTNVMKLNALEIGLYISIIPIMLGIVSPLAGTLSDKVGSKIIPAIGLCILILGFYSASTFDEHTTPMEFVLKLLPLGAGMGLFQPPNNNSFMGNIGHARLGIASGLLALMRALGRTVGIAILGAYWVMKNNNYLILGKSKIQAHVAAFQDTAIICIIILSISMIILFLRKDKNSKSSNVESPSSDVY